MKRCKFLVAFALIIVLAMPIRASAAVLEWPEGILPPPDGFSYEDGWRHVLARSPYHYGAANQPDRIWMFMFKINQDDGELRVVLDGDYLWFNFSHELNDSTYTVHQYYLADPSISSCTWLDNKTSFTASSTDMRSFPYYEDGYFLYSDVDVYNSDDSIFFQPPRTPGKLEMSLTETLQTMEVTPLTEVVKILPIGLACLVGWIGLRKALSLLQGLLFQA